MYSGWVYEAMENEWKKNDLPRTQTIHMEMWSFSFGYIEMSWWDQFQKHMEYDSVCFVFQLDYFSRLFPTWAASFKFGCGLCVCACFFLLISVSFISLQYAHTQWIFIHKIFGEIELIFTAKVSSPHIVWIYEFMVSYPYLFMPNIRVFFLMIFICTNQIN